MHEDALLRDLCAKIDEVARAHPGARVVRVHVALGVLSHLDEPRLRSAWAHAMGSGPAADATLEVDLFPGIDHPLAAAVVLRSLTFDDGLAEPRPGSRTGPRAAPGGA